MISRRAWLLGLLASSAGGIYAWQRGMRYPMLSLEPSPLSKSVEGFSLAGRVSDCFQTPHTNTTFRAFAPEPSIEITAAETQNLAFRVNNISPKAELSANLSVVTERREGIDRTISTRIRAGETLTLKWQFPTPFDFSFAAIGDTGGQKELQWCLRRGEELGASFLLHLGDFYYQDGDYESAIAHFYESPVPCYVSIGNHDFHDGRMLHAQFSDYIGPFNHAFTLGETQFLNIDTAANFLPRSGGKRGAFFEQISRSESIKRTIAFTHKPLHDPTGESTHDIGHSGERDWLIQQLKQVKVDSLLSGHIHIFDRSTYQGIDNIIVGQGLGHQDLLTGRNDTSKIAIGKVTQNLELQYQFEALNMPMSWHCHPRTDPVKASLRGSEHQALLDKIDAACNDDTPST